MACRKRIYFAAVLGHFLLGALISLSYMAVGINLPEESAGAQAMYWVFRLWVILWFPGSVLHVPGGLYGILALWLITSAGWVLFGLWAWRQAAMRLRRRAGTAEGAAAASAVKRRR